jgi:aminoglycoside phosphotransferase (APT) family kinase protein
MRERWSRITPVIPLDRAQAEALIAPALPHAHVARLEPLSGGLANTNLRCVLDDGSSVRLRLYQRDAKQAQKEAALARLVKDRVPAPQYLHLGDANNVAGVAYAVIEWIEGARLETLAEALDDTSLAQAGRAVGSVLAKIHSFTFLRPGFFNTNLEIMPYGGDFSLVPFLTRCLIDGKGSERVGEDLAHRVVDHAARAERSLSKWDEPPCLAHFDFNGSNILMRQENGVWAVAGIIDWEFAASATPAGDFGNLLRPPLGLRPGFADAVAKGYREAGGKLPPDWLVHARLADLTAWAEFLTRPNIGEALIADARATFEAVLADS